MNFGADNAHPEPIENTAVVFSDFVPKNCGTERVFLLNPRIELFLVGICMPTAYFSRGSIYHA